MASKTANVTARVEPDIKEKAESILSDLGIPASTAINMFYRQIIEWNGIPFRPAKAPHSLPAAYEDLGEDNISSRLIEGFTQIKEGRCTPADDFFDNLMKEFSDE